MNREQSLTDTELELMHVLWKLGEANVKKVQSELEPDRKLAYTSVSTILRILVKKGYCQIKSEGRNHIYQPTLKREEYEKASLSKIVDQVFLGETSQLVKHLVKSKGLSKEDKNKLLQILNDSDH